MSLVMTSLLRFPSLWAAKGREIPKPQFMAREASRIETLATAARDPAVRDQLRELVANAARHGCSVRDGRAPDRFWVAPLPPSRSRR
jgi:hypothetical protein